MQRKWSCVWMLWAVLWGVGVTGCGGTDTEGDMLEAKSEPTEAAPEAGVEQASAVFLLTPDDATLMVFFPAPSGSDQEHGGERPGEHRHDRLLGHLDVVSTPVPVFGGDTAGMREREQLVAESSHGHHPYLQGVPSSNRRAGSRQAQRAMSEVTSTHFSRRALARPESMASCARATPASAGGLNPSTIIEKGLIRSRSGDPTSNMV